MFYVITIITRKKIYRIHMARNEGQKQLEGMIKIGYIKGGMGKGAP
jgi:hypothetical protein